jgi:hypothetical protein
MNWGAQLSRSTDSFRMSIIVSSFSCRLLRSLHENVFRSYHTFSTQFLSSHSGHQTNIITFIDVNACCLVPSQHFRIKAYAGANKYSSYELSLSWAVSNQFKFILHLWTETVNALSLTTKGWGEYLDLRKTGNRNRGYRIINTSQLMLLNWLSWENRINFQKWWTG